MKSKEFTEQDAYDLGLKDGREAAERGEPLSSGLTWDDNQDFNEAYDRGVNAAQKAFVLENNPTAKAVEVGGLWYIETADGSGPLAEMCDAEYAAWEEAASATGRRVSKQPYNGGLR